MSLRRRAVSEADDLDRLVSQTSVTKSMACDSIELEQLHSLYKPPDSEKEAVLTLPEDISQAIRDNAYQRIVQWIDTLDEAQRGRILNLGKRSSPYIGKANALHLAVWYNKTDIVSLLIEHGADPNCVTSKGHAAIHLACASKICGKEIVVILVNNEAMYTKKTRNHQRTPLLIAAFKGKTEVVRYLLDELRQSGGTAELHKHIHIQDSDGNSALQKAAFAGSCDIIALLLNAGADPNLASPNGQTALHVAASKENHEVVKLLLSKGSYVHLQDVDGETALHLGILAACYSVVSLLLDAGADPNHVSIKRGKTPLQMAAAKGKPEIVKCLLSKGAVVHKQDEGGRTALHEAVSAGSYDATAVLLDADADPNCVTSEGCAPIHLSCECDHGLDIMQLLVERGAKYDIYKKIDKRAALHLTALLGKSEFVKYLLNQGATLRLDCWKNTPLHLAARAPGAVEVMKMLLDAGVKPDAKNANKETPFAIACRYGYRENIGYLLQTCCTEDLRLAIEAGHSDEARELVRSKRWFEMLTQTYRLNNVETTPFRELVKSMPDVAEDVLNQCVLYTPDINQGSTEFGVKFVYELIDDFQNEGNAVEASRSAPPTYSDTLSANTAPFSTSWGPATFVKSNHPLEIMVDKKRDNLLQHPVVLSLVHYKWRKFGQYMFFANLFSYCIFLAFLTAFILVVPTPQSVTCAAVFNTSNSAEQGINCNRSAAATGFLYFGAVVIILCAIGRLGSELAQLIGLQKHNWKLYILDWTNWMEITLFCFSILFVWVFHTECLCPFDWQWQIGVIALFLAWMTFIVLLSKFPVLGIFVLMFLKVFNTFLKILVLAFFLVISFGLVFHALLLEPGITRSPFSTPLRSLFKTLSMSTGELDFDSFFRLSPNGDSDSTEPLRFAAVTYILWVVFVVLMPILLLNLLTGLAVDDIQQIQRQASRRKLELQIGLALTVEEYLHRINVKYRSRHIIRALCFFPNAALPVEPIGADKPSHVLLRHRHVSSLLWDLSLFLWGGDVYYDLEKMQRIRQTKEGYVSAQEKGQQLAVLKHSNKTSSVEFETLDCFASIKREVEESNARLTGIEETAAKLSDSTERRLAEIEKSVSLIAQRSVQSEKSVEEIKLKLELLIERLSQFPDDI